MPPGIVGERYSCVEVFKFDKGFHRLNDTFSHCAVPPGIVGERYSCVEAFKFDKGFSSLYDIFPIVLCLLALSVSHTCAPTLQH